jgi:hypothetical protein
MTMEWAALVTWVVTAGFGFYMLATWVRAGGARQTSGSTSNFQPPVVFGHFLLAAAGLVVWIIYLAVDKRALAWVAFADLVVVATIGDLLVLRWLRDRRGERTSTVEAGSATGGTTRTRTGTTLAEQQIPPAVVATHGVFAVATVILVLLVALGVGS